MGSVGERRADRRMARQPQIVVAAEGKHLATGLTIVHDVWALWLFALLGYFYGQAAAHHVPVPQLIAAGLCMQFFLFGMWSVLYAYTPELYPTRSRGTGAGFASSIGRIGSLLGPYIVGVLLPITGQAGVFTLGAASTASRAGSVRCCSRPATR